ncbi:MAG TPA: CDP-alcohol phosphatidyltransferase family protein [Acidimicrobiales bacterium]|nr:CDP-alcohol phosphatidyltransferase family protein [Acidimicrobiales bacterium]
MTETDPSGPDRAESTKAEPDLSRVATIPNAISLGRLMCVPLFLWLLFGRDERLAAAGLLALLGATDWVDGFIARRYNQVSTVGKILDPTADRLLLVVGVVSILVYGAVPPVIAWLAIAREGSVAILALLLAALGAKRIDVSWWGKTGTFLLMVAFPLFLLGDGHGPAHAVAWVVSVAGLIAGWYANLLYVPQGRRALREGREAKKGRGGPAAGGPRAVEPEQGNPTANREITR